MQDALTRYAEFASRSPHAQRPATKRFDSPRTVIAESGIDGTCPVGQENLINSVHSVAVKVDRIERIADSVRVFPRRNIVIYCNFHIADDSTRLTHCRFSGEIDSRSGEIPAFSQRHIQTLHALPPLDVGESLFMTVRAVESGNVIYVVVARIQRSCRIPAPFVVRAVKVLRSR